eukprot:6177025-Pleurochrysis_carterae.AAC.3
MRRCDSSAGLFRLAGRTRASLLAPNYALWRARWRRHAACHVPDAVSLAGCAKYCLRSDIMYERVPKACVTEQVCPLKLCTSRICGQLVQVNAASL